MSRTQKSAVAGEEDTKRSSEGYEDKDKNKSTSPSEVVKITLEDYLRTVKVRPGLQASFKAEAASTPEALEPRTAEEWAEALLQQSKRVYK